MFDEGSVGILMGISRSDRQEFMLEDWTRLGGPPIWSVEITFIWNCWQ
ncbi:hypothetical protein Oscil6304_1283 [Oscillatoria acuminata PCC 6304]|uniref:Uncharacterized protein n=1 Tax=Oscillatoria acuminata PCC 6304 TaxID=56110 RepID=K9TDP6_9CYAN|nr:hypothetical protein Oscil6304_1283 [Oscillatoria acuminata PCC 6304]